MLHTTPLNRFRVAAAISLVAGTALLAGCAQQRPAGYYDTPHESTLSDAQLQAQGGRGSRAPSQLQLGFGDEKTKARAGADQRDTTDSGTNAQAAEQSLSRAHARPLLEPRTFLGTVPCLTGDAHCPASRITLTFAPSGEWRARTQLLDTLGSDRPIIQHGCWDITSTDPLRIALQTTSETTPISFEFVTDNVLRITRINDTKPMLDYRLTRQADIDPISELADQAAITCN